MTVRASRLGAHQQQVGQRELQAHQETRVELPLAHPLRRSCGLC